MIVRDNKLIKLTTDHVLTNRDELSQYQSSKWYQEKSRLISQGKVKGFKLIAISRTLGDAFFEDAISAKPDITQFELKVGDKLIIGSDGLWNFISDEQLLKTIKGTKNDADLADSLVELALLNKSTGNVTVVMVGVAGS